MYKVLVTPTSFLKPQNSLAKAMLEEFADEIIYCESGKPLEGNGILSMLDGVDGYLAGLDYITADVIERMPPSVKVISRYGAGYDRVDLDACRKRGIMVANTPAANATAVCELAFGLMLSIARSIPALHAAVEQGQWPRANGMELAGKTLGIVGLGAIGKKLAERAMAFGMKVVAYDPYVDQAYAKAKGIATVALDDLLQCSDVVSLHVPCNDQTRHMIDEASIRRMRDGAIIINTSRGGLIDERAAAQAVSQGKLRGMGMDTFETEPLCDSPLLGIPNVILTPHTGAHTQEAISNMGMMAVNNLIAMLLQEPCPYIIAK